MGWGVYRNRMTFTNDQNDLTWTKMLFKLIFLVVLYLEGGLYSCGDSKYISGRPGVSWTFAVSSVSHRAFSLCPCPLASLAHRVLVKISFSNM